MKTIQHLTIAGTIGGLVALVGCSNGGSTSGSNETLPEVDVDVPTQAEADAAAAREITPDNADQAFEDLQAEIEREAGGG